jgi:hypothetical protein
MTNAARLSRTLFTAAVVSACLCSFSISSAAQAAQGNNAVYDSNGNCTSSSCGFSGAFIDASMFLNPVTQGKDFCDTINGILRSKFGNTYPSAGAVIDARGISGSALTCTIGSPWSENGVYVNKPSVILLPAGTITTSIAWVLPANTKLIGTAKGNPSLGTNNYILETTIQPSTSFSGAVVEFGDSAHCPSSGCQGISVEGAGPPHQFEGAPPKLAWVGQLGSRR